MSSSSSPGPTRGAIDLCRTTYGWDSTGLVAAEIGLLVGARLSQLPGYCAETVAGLAQTSGDCRLVAEYLRAVAVDNRSVVRICEEIARELPGLRCGQLRYALGRLRYAKPVSGRVVSRSTVTEILDADDQVNQFVADPGEREVITTLLRDLGAGLSPFIEHQHEIPGPNARIRQGVVKTWFLPDGRQVVSKRANALKPGRFRREQLAHAEIQRRLPGGPDRTVQLGRASDGRHRALSVVPVLAMVRDGGTGRTYSISPWVQSTSVEAILLEHPSGTDRDRVLRDYRDLLDLLFDHGILWGDLSPRNVLVTRERDRDVFHLVDFEKTSFCEAPVSAKDRIQFCRGQVAVEELGVICLPAELRECLHGYFDPAGWDLDSVEPVPFAPRPEISAVLLARGVTAPEFGLYNRTDLQIFDVRAPYLDTATGLRRYPGQVGFRVEHYLSCAGHYRAHDYDRITTDVLIAARQFGCFEGALDRVSRAVDAVERCFVVAEFADLLDGRRIDGATTPPAAQIAELTTLLDLLDGARADPVHFRAACGVSTRSRGCR